MSENIEIVLVDIGNSQIKTAEVIGGRLSETGAWESLEELMNAYDIDIPFAVCSTRSVSITRGNTLLLTYRTRLPIKINYKTPETLGTDRIAAAVGAYDLFPDENTLVIDLGTCMTIDFISEKGVFEGGIIAPGLSLRMKAMSRFTSNLPDISSDWASVGNHLIGQSTKEGLLSGSYGGLLHEIRGVIAEFEKKFTSINVILIGGDAHFFESKLKAHIFAGSKIVQKGLYRIWKYQ